MNIGFIIGRFQPFHKGHLHLVSTALKHFDKLYIFIGSTQEYRTLKNPFTYLERIDIIDHSIPFNSNVIYVPLVDSHSDKEWIDQISNYFTSQKININNLTYVHFNKDNNTTISNELLRSLKCNMFEIYQQPPIINASDIRKMIFKDNKNLSEINDLIEESKSIIEFYTRSLAQDHLYLFS